MQKGLPFARKTLKIPVENSEYSFLRFWLALLHSVSYYFFLYRSPSSSLCMVFDAISSNIDEILWISPSAVLVFGDFDVDYKNWLTYTGATNRPRELCYNFSISVDLTQMVNFPTQISDCDLIVLVFRIYSLLLTLILQWLYLYREILLLLFQFLLTFHQNQTGMIRFIA